MRGRIILPLSAGDFRFGIKHVVQTDLEKLTLPEEPMVGTSFEDLTEALGKITVSAIAADVTTSSSLAQMNPNWTENGYSSEKTEPQPIEGTIELPSTWKLTEDGEVGATVDVTVMVTLQKEPVEDTDTYFVVSKSALTFDMTDVWEEIDPEKITLDQLKAKVDVLTLAAIKKDENGTSSTEVKSLGAMEFTWDSGLEKTAYKGYTGEQTLKGTIKLPSDWKVEGSEEEKATVQITVTFKSESEGEHTHVPTPSAIKLEMSGATGLALKELSVESVTDGVKVVTDDAMLNNSPSAIGLELECECGKTVSAIVEFSDYDEFDVETQTKTGSVVYLEDAENWSSDDVSVEATVKLTSIVGDDGEIVGEWNPDDGWKNHEYSDDGSGKDTTSMTMKNQECITEVKNGVITVDVTEGMYYFKSSDKDRANAAHAWAAVELLGSKLSSEEGAQYWLSNDQEKGDTDVEITGGDSDLWLDLDTLYSNVDAEKTVCYYIIKTGSGNKRLGAAPVKITFKNTSGNTIEKREGYEVEVVDFDK